jgi:uncharacterized protein (TIGR03067 family)
LQKGEEITGEAMNGMFVGLALVIAAPALKGPVKGDPPPIVGEWALTEWLQSGQPVGFTEGAFVEFKADGKRIWHDGPGTEPSERGYKLLPKTTPAAIDLIRPSGNAEPDQFFGIYKIEGDTLVVSVNDQGLDRPKTFDDKEIVYQKMTYKRMKKE